MGSRVPEVIEALVQLGKTEPAYEADKHGKGGVVVADGPQDPDDAVPDWLIIGFDGDPDGELEAATSVGGWSDLGTGREEEFQITVAAIASNGDGDIVSARKRAYEIAAPLEEWLRTNPNLGLRSLEAAIAGTRLVQDQTEDGVQAVLLLTVAGRAFT